MSNDDFEDMLAGFDRVIHDKELQQRLLDAGFLVRTDEQEHGANMRTAIEKGVLRRRASDLAYVGLDRPTPPTGSTATEPRTEAGMDEIWPWEPTFCEWCDRELAVGLGEGYSGLGPLLCKSCVGLDRCVDDMCHGAGYCMHSGGPLDD